MKKEDIKESGVTEEVIATEEASDGQKGQKKWDKNRFEFVLFANDFLICKRSFSINGYIENSMSSADFKNEVDRMVELINNDLISKSRIYTWLHFPEFKFVDETIVVPEWEPEIVTEPLIPEGESVFRFAILDNGVEVVSRAWDARFCPVYIRKNVDLTNRQVKISRNGQVNIYDKDEFFGSRDQVFGDLYVLKSLIEGKEDLVPKIQEMIYEVCSSQSGYFEKLSDYCMVDEYKNHDIKRDEEGNGIYAQKTFTDEEGNEVPMYDAFGQPWMVPVLEENTTAGKKYNLNIEAYNRKIDSKWGAAVAEKTKKYMSELYVSQKEKYFKKKSEA